MSFGHGLRRAQQPLAQNVAGAHGVKTHHNPQQDGLGLIVGRAAINAIARSVETASGERRVALLRGHAGWGAHTARSPMGERLSLQLAEAGLLEFEPLSGGADGELLDLGHAGRRGLVRLGDHRRAHLAGVGAAGVVARTAGQHPFVVHSGQ